MASIIDEKTWLDKSTWGSGPWQDEPDRIYWVEEETGYPCLARRSDASGSFCGYVGIPKDHFLFNKGYDNASSIYAPGGLTFSARCDERDRERGICHPPAYAGEERWWLGFDHGHAFDYQPAMAALLKTLGQEPYSGWPTRVYTSAAQVIREVEHLAHQLKGANDARIAQREKRRVARANTVRTEARRVSGVRGKARTGNAPQPR